jgi:4-amino-4-deoxy-L-arabinose transferase-like glycosyltransferase
VRDSILWGIFLGLAFLSKPTAIVFLGLTPVCFYLLSDIKQLKKNIKKAVLLPGIAVIIGEGINNLQRLSSVYFLMDRKNQQFQQPLSEILKDPFGLTLGNLNGFISWLIPYTLLFFFWTPGYRISLQVQWRKV